MPWRHGFTQPEELQPSKRPYSDLQRTENLSRQWLFRSDAQCGFGLQPRFVEVVIPEVGKGQIDPSVNVIGREFDGSCKKRYRT